MVLVMMPVMVMASWNLFLLSQVFTHCRMRRFYFPPFSLKKEMETVLVAAFLLVGVLVTRANYLYGRSAYEAGECGGPFVPRWVSRLLCYRYNC
jgi:hypothetical protein